MEGLWHALKASKRTKGLKNTRAQPNSCLQILKLEKWEQDQEFKVILNHKKFGNNLGYMRDPDSKNKGKRKEQK